MPSQKNENFAKYALASSAFHFYVSYPDKNVDCVHFCLRRALP